MAFLFFSHFSFRKGFGTKSGIGNEKKLTGRDFSFEKVPLHTYNIWI